MSIQHEALPPFATLVALESTVRLGSFAAASRELRVSQVAVARKVGELETWLGQPLMTRRRPRVEPTAEALSLAAVVQGGVAQLVAEFERIRQASRDPLRVSLYTSSAFSLFWLTPRLPRFHARYPDVELSLVTNTRSERCDFSRCDLGVVYASRSRPEFEEIELFHDTYRPMASPGYLAARERGARVDDFARDTLLRWLPNEGGGGDWDTWFAEHGGGYTRRTHIENFNDYGLLLHAAMDGRGVALGAATMVSGLLKAGRLVVIGARRLRPVESFRLLVNPASGADRRPAVRALCDWLLAEAHAAEAG
ncbi:MAG: LysR family transcriptional regulator [Planctomycetes bacterium]|nr:LysR family transcriptional regulator [Planctomycetota bacterium]